MGSDVDLQQALVVVLVLVVGKRFVVAYIGKLEYMTKWTMSVPRSNPVDVDI